MSVPVISVSQMREWEKATWAGGVTAAAVIARVGGIVAQRIQQLTKPGDFILVLAGKGHNGDDTRRAAESLANLRVQICNVADPERDFPQVNHFLEQQPALIVDGLFGIGLNRPLDEKWQALIGVINDRKCRVLSVDVPSGLNADTGQPEGAAIRASITLTLASPKQGLLLPPAWPYVGRLEVAPDIGLVKCPFKADLNWTLPQDFKHFPPDRSATGHKGEYGRLSILAGSFGFHGAAVLASRGAQRARPGLITLYTMEPTYHVIASQMQAVMVNVWLPGTKLPADYNAVLVGPGLAAPDLPDALKLMVRLSWRDTTCPMVVDASALDWLPITPLPKHLTRVITPHPGEAAQLLRCSAAQIQANRVGSLREISKRLGNCWVVLKGPQTLIGRSTDEIVVNSSGNPELAQGGAGDVLSGYLAGLLAQPALQTDVLKTLAYGVWQHGVTADRLSRTKKNWVIEDLAAEIGNCELPE